MKTRILLAALIVLFASVAVVLLWKPEAQRTSIVPAPDRSVETASLEQGLDSPPRHADGSVAARAPLKKSTPTKLSRIDSVPITPAGEHELSWKDEKKHRVFGSVRSRLDGTPIPGAQISNSNGSMWISSMRGPAAGTYEIKTTAASVDWLTCRAQGWQSTTRTVTWINDADTQVDFDLDPAVEMIVRLCNRDGRPLYESLSGEDDLETAQILRPVFVSDCIPRGARVSGSVLSVRAESLSASKTDAWFRVSLESQTGGCCCLALGDRVLDSVRFDASTREIVLVTSRDEIRFETGSLRLVLVDVDNESAFAGARVLVSPSVGKAREARSDLRGNVLVESLPEGDVKIAVIADNAVAAEASSRLRASSPGAGELSLGIATIRAGRVTDMGRVPMRRYVSISGWIDLPPDGVKHLSVFALHDDPVRGAQLVRTWPDSSGNFRFDALQCGYYRVGCDMLPSVDPLFVDARASDVQGLRIVATAADWQGAARTK